MSRWVPFDGPTPARILILGERPGKEEAYSGHPFARRGKSGMEIRRYLLNAGINFDDCRVGNVCLDYKDSNPDPEDWEVERDRPIVEKEIRECQPQYILCVGRFAARWFLGDEFEMEWGHGMVYDPCHGEPYVFAAYHPSYGLHQASVTPLVADDYQKFGDMVQIGMAGYQLPKDEYPHPVYRELTREDVRLGTLPKLSRRLPIYIDTEGSIEHPWGLSFTQKPGVGYVVKAKQKGILAGLNEAIHRLDLLVVCHHVQHDMGVLRAMGIEGFRFQDTMVKSHQLCLYPQGLKPLSRRLCGTVQREYGDVVGEADKEKALVWLGEAMVWADNLFPSESKTHSKRTTRETDGRKSRPTSPKSPPSSNKSLVPSPTQP